MDVLGQDKREGLGRKAHSRFVLVLLLLVSSMLLLSSLYAAEASVFKKARETVIDASAPVLSIFAGPIAFVQDVIGNVEDYFGVMEQNKALREENAELRQWMRQALELRATIAGYEQLQSYNAPPDILPIDAFVIGESNDVYAHSMIVNAGRRVGVARGQAVVDDRGLVGHIVDTGSNSARVLLLTDIQSRIPVYVEGADVDGILIGRSRGRPVIEFTENSEPVTLAVGQRVITSGSGGALPRGLSVGEIRRASRDEAIVELDANYARTRTVRVINYAFPTLDNAAGDDVTEDDITEGEAEDAASGEQEASADAPQGE